MVPGKKKKFIWRPPLNFSGGRHLILVSYMKQKLIDTLGWNLTQLQLSIFTWVFSFKEILCSLAVNHRNVMNRIKKVANIEPINH